MKKRFFGMLLCSCLFLSAKAQTQQTEIEVLKDSMEQMRLDLDSITQAEKQARQLLTEVTGREAGSASEIDSLNNLNALLSKQLEQYRVQNDSMKLALNRLQQKYQLVVAHADSVEGQYNKILADYQEMEDHWKRRKYVNIGYSSADLTIENIDGKVKSDYSVSIVNGRTFYLHKKPLFNMIKFGLDFGYIDINLAQYNPIGGSEDEDIDYDGNQGWDGGYYPDGDDDSDDNFISDMLGDIMPDKLYKAEVGVHFGPSITVNPIDYLMVNAYFRYIPSYSMKITQDLDFAGTFASYFNLGIAVSYKMLSIGLEKRWGSATFNTDEINEFGEEVSVKRKWSTSGPRFYISFRL